MSSLPHGADAVRLYDVLHSDPPVERTWSNSKILVVCSPTSVVILASAARFPVVGAGQMLPEIHKRPRWLKPLKGSCSSGSSERCRELHQTQARAGQPSIVLVTVMVQQIGENPGPSGS